jgi:hypothetical protein
MKNLQVQAIMAFALICAPLMAAQSAYVYQVRLEVVADDPVMKASIISAASRELRKLGDVSVTENKAAFYVLHIVAIHAKNKAGDERGYVFAVTVTWPKTDAEQKPEDWINTYLLMDSDLDDICRGAIAHFDPAGSYIEIHRRSRRNGRQIRRGF